METEKESSYQRLNNIAPVLMEGESHPIANLANMASLLGTELPGINWAGFYLMHGGELVLGPFWGNPACRRIRLGRGVCGTAAQQGSNLVVADVHQFPGHIACDAASAAEIVLPLWQGGKVIGVLDIDSPTLGRFDGQDEAGLATLARSIEACCDWASCGYSLT